MRRLAIASFVLVAALSGCGGGGGGKAKSEKVTVPDVRHNGVDYGFERLRNAGLRVSVPTFPASYTGVDSFVPTGQSPRPGAVVRSDSTVTLRGPFTMVPGRRALPGKRKKFGIVPNVVGLSVTDAAAKIRDAGLFWRMTGIPPLRASTADKLFDAYTVKSQRPASGAELPWGGIGPGGTIDSRRSQVTLVPRLAEP